MNKLIYVFSFVALMMAGFASAKALGAFECSANTEVSCGDKDKKCCKKGEKKKECEKGEAKKACCKKGEEKACCKKKEGAAEEATEEKAE